MQYVRHSTLSGYQTCSLTKLMMTLYRVSPSCGALLLLVVAAVTIGSQPGRSQTTAGTGPPTAPTPQPKSQDDFLKRLIDFYRADWSGTAAAGPAAAPRGGSSPFGLPPFPRAGLVH